MDEVDARVLDSRVTSLETRVDEHGKQIDELRLNREHDSTMLSQIQAAALDTKAGIAKLEEKIDDARASPAKRWETVVSTVIAGVVSAVVAYVVFRAGLQP